MHWLLLLILTVECYANVTNVCSNVKESLLVRRRRHLTFPEGSNVVLTLSLVKAFMTHAPSGWNIALEMDVLYPLPNEKVVNSFFRRKLHHRQKKELWEQIRSGLELHNINGKSCILRSICEARDHLVSQGKSLVHDILRAIFEAPVGEEDFLDEMIDYSELSKPDFCTQMNECPISLIDFVLSINRVH